jgi:2-dehydropantoate 2-reductase
MRSGKKHIYIIGSGAIGKALAVFLRISGQKVTLIRGSVNDGSVKTESIRVEMQDGTVSEADIEIRTLDTLPEIDGIIVLANKSFGNQQLAVSLKGKTGNSPIVLLQNGLGVEKTFVDQGFAEVYRCVLFVTSQTVDDLTVRFKPVGICPVGIEQGGVDHLEDIVQQLHTPEFSFKSEADIQHIIWKKAIANCVFNSVCPLLEADNGIFHRNMGALEIARRIIAECVTIAKAKNILLEPTEVEESLLLISRSSDGQLISTLQDIYNKRKTEIDTLNFEIVRIADSLGRSEAVLETKLLGELTKIKSEMDV